MEVCIITADERLLRELTLLLPEGYTRTEKKGGAIVIADGDTVQTAGADIVISREAIDGPFISLKRPFLFGDFIRALSLVEEDSHGRLTPTEEKLFALLKNANGMPVPRQTLMSEVWGEGASEGLLNLYIHYLREKLEKDGKRRIFAARGKGYFYKC